MSQNIFALILMTLMLLGIGSPLQAQDPEDSNVGRAVTCDLDGDRFTLNPREQTVRLKEKRSFFVWDEKAASYKKKRFLLSWLPKSLNLNQEDLDFVALPGPYRYKIFATQSPKSGGLYIDIATKTRNKKVFATFTFSNMRGDKWRSQDIECENGG